MTLVVFCIIIHAMSTYIRKTGISYASKATGKKRRRGSVVGGGESTNEFEGIELDGDVSGLLNDDSDRGSKQEYILSEEDDDEGELLSPVVKRVKKDLPTGAFYFLCEVDEDRWLNNL